MAPFTSVGNARHSTSRRTPSIRLSHSISLLALPLSKLISRRSAARSPRHLHMHDDMPRYFLWSDTSSRQIYKNRNTKCLVSVFIRYDRCKDENGHNPCPPIPSFLLFSFGPHSTHYHSKPYLVTQYLLNRQRCLANHPHLHLNDNRQKSGSRVATCRLWVPWSLIMIIKVDQHYINQALSTHQL
jgi:hypothetical protein